MTTSFEPNEVNPVVSSSDDNEAKLPDFVFMGTDGQNYEIGNTPHSFVVDFKEYMKTQNPADYTLDSKRFDQWLWMHLVVVEGQRHIKLEDVYRLYFEVDMPDILQSMFTRFLEAQVAQAKAVEVIQNIPYNFAKLIDEWNKTTEENAKTKSEG